MKGKRSVGLSLPKKSVLIFGGSRGARPINDAFVEAIEQFGNKSYEILYVTGEVHYDKVMEAVKQKGIRIMLLLNLSFIICQKYLQV